MAAIALEHLSKLYPNGHRALSDFSLHIADGELMVLVGPSGCGKSTLLRLLAGLETPESGTIRIDQRIATHLSPQQRNVAMVFQDYALYPTMTVRGNLEFPLKMRRLPDAERRRQIDWAAGLLGLGDVLDRLPKQLSGGQRQRVAMGRALVRDPSVFLLDEPLSNLDAKLRVQVRAEIVDLQRRTEATMIYVTHDQFEAMTMGHRVAVLSGGKLQQVGTARNLYEHPGNLFVAGFIGAPPMNLFPGRMLRSLVDQQGACDEGAAHSFSLPREMSWTAGIRPENLRVMPNGQGFPAEITHLEYLGHESLVHFRFVGVAAEFAAAGYIARIEGARGCAPGQKVRVALPPDGGLVWFDERGLLADRRPD